MKKWNQNKQGIERKKKERKKETNKQTNKGNKKKEIKKETKLVSGIKNEQIIRKKVKKKEKDGV